MSGEGLVDKVRRFIDRYQLVSADKKYLLGLSGGADSVALLRVMLELDFQIEAVHCHFHLRDQEADRDEQFCKELCQRLGVHLHLLHFETQLYAMSHKMSLEMAARELRYRFFEQMRVDVGAEGILVAHHQDDSVETVLMNLVRGTGIHGLTGIAPRNGRILRPLLCVQRGEIIDYLQSIQQDYVTDSTNLSDEMVRNKIRLRVLPVLREINPSVADSVMTTAARLSQAADMLDDVLRQRSREATVSSDEHQTIFDMGKIPNEYVLFHLLRPFTFSPAMIEEIDAYMRANPTSGKVFASGTHELLVDRGLLIVQPLMTPAKPFRIPEPGTYVLSDNQRLSVRAFVMDQDFVISKSPEKVCLDADRMAFPLVLRPVEQGDRFCPLGMAGSRLVSDFMTDRKMSLFEKRRQLVVEDATGKIVWLVGLRPDNRCRISKNSTSALVMEIFS